MKKKLVLVLTILALGIAGCGNSEAEISDSNIIDNPVTEYSEDGIEIIDFDSSKAPQEAEYEMLQNMTAYGVIYYKGNPTEYNKATECSIIFDEPVTTENGETKTIVLPVKLCMKAEYTEDCMDYSGCITPSLDLCDSESGVLMTGETVEGQDGYTISGTIVSDGNSIAVSAECNADCQEVNWVAEGSGFVKDVVFTATYMVTVPADYDGLAIKVTPVYNYSEYEAMPDRIGTHAHDYMPEGVRLFKL